MRLPLCLTAALAAAAPGLAQDSPKYNMDVTTDDIRLGTPITGPSVSDEDLKGRVVLVEFWGVNCPPCLKSMPHLSKANAELGEYGLVMVGIHAQDAKPEAIKAKAQEFGANFAITDRGTVEGGRDFTGIPHTMIFGHDGKCVYRGHPMESGEALRKAIGEGLVSRAGEGEMPKQVADLAESLKAGTMPGLVLAKLQRLKGSPDAATARGAARLLTAMAEASDVPAGADLLERYLRLKDRAAKFQGTPAGDAAAAQVKEMTSDNATVREIYALQALQPIRELDAAMAKQIGSLDPSSEQVRRALAGPLKKLRSQVARMAEKFPTEKATGEAKEILAKYGIEQ